MLSSDKFPPPADLRPDDYTKFQIHQANSLLAETLATENVIVPGSGHNHHALRDHRSLPTRSSRSWTRCEPDAGNECVTQVTRELPEPNLRLYE